MAAQQTRSLRNYTSRQATTPVLDLYRHQNAGVQIGKRCSDKGDREIGGGSEKGASLNYFRKRRDCVASQPPQIGASANRPLLKTGGEV